MKLNFSFLFLFLFLAAALLHGQLKSVSGKVFDLETGKPLSYGNIRVTGTTHGTSGNKEGEYQLKLRPGKYLLSASYIGYLSDSIYITVTGDTGGINFYLTESTVSLPEITVMPGENPALNIIRQAISRKNYRNSVLNSFEFEAYTKGVIRTQEEMTGGGGAFTLEIGSSDSSELFITGILENQSRGYFKKPDLYKELILSRKQTSNFPSSINVLTGGRLIQNFYDESINFLGMDLPGPLADDALEYYDYYIQNTVAADSHSVYKIFITPLESDDPGFTGNIFIRDDTYDLVQIDLQLNRAANIGGIFDSVNVFQQFSVFDMTIVMPVDYRLFAEANVLSLAKFGFELSTILYDYKINPSIKDDFFDNAALTVLPDADKKDSLYWSGIQSIPGTGEELTAYRRIDSLSKVPVSFWDEFSILSSRIKLTEGFFISAPLSMYHFNRVEGHTLDFGIFAEDQLDLRLNGNFHGSYGFADKKAKTNLSASYLLGDYRTTRISLNAYNKIKILFGESINYNDLTSTLLALLSKYEFRDYYYSRGLDFNISAEVFPVVNLSGGFRTYSDKTAFNNSDYSFFAREKTFRINPPVDEANINQLSIGFTIDPRKYIEDGYFRRRISEGKTYFIISGNVSHSNTTWLKSSNKFSKYELTLQSVIKSFRSSAISIRAYGMYTDGELPYQDLYAVPGNIDLIGQDFTFRTLEVNQVLGNRLITLNVENNLRDEIFRLLKIPFLRSSEIQLKTFFNAAYVLNSSRSPSLPDAQRQEFKHPFYEIGFGIGHILFPIELEFGWKLNYRGTNNFRIGMNSFVF